MAFDPNLNKEICAETVEFENTRIIVGVYSYNEGEKKLQLSRENKNAQDQWSFAKLGRMTKEEAEAIVPLMQKCIEQM